jgi:hypothetical protein
MPFTPLHYPVAYGVSKIYKSLSLPGLIVGSFIPDIEVPILWLFFTGVFPDHLILHSLIGALTLGTILAILVTRYLFAPIIARFFKVNRGKLDEACSLNNKLVLSCVIGIIGHILLDYPIHWFNPIFWPLVDPFLCIGPLVLLFSFSGELPSTPFHLANAFMSVIMGFLWFLIIFKNRNDNLWESIWLGELPSPELKSVE